MQGFWIFPRMNPGGSEIRKKFVCCPKINSGACDQIYLGHPMRGRGEFTALSPHLFITQSGIMPILDAYQLSTNLNF
jgi:hypothetical protein